MILHIEDLHVYYGSAHVLKGISLDIKKGDIVALIGSNGAGKSTLIKTVMGLVPVNQGKIVFEGGNIANLTTAKIVKAGISFVPEGRRIFPLLNVIENLEIGAYLRSDKKELAEDIDHVFSMFKILRDRKKQLGGSLSGGEQQMLALGRALMGHPKLLLMDEPSLGLAPILVDQIFNIIKSINEQGISVLLVEQNAQMALNIARYGIVMETGSIVAHGSSNELMNDEQIKNIYLGI